MNYYHLFSSPVPGLIFRDEEDFRTGVNLLAGSISDTDVILYCYYLMNNHFHLLLSGDDTASHSFFLRYKGRLVKYLARKYGSSGNLAGMEMGLVPVESEAHFRQEVCYILRNPFKAGIDAPYSYPWSSGWIYFNPILEWIKGERVETLSKRQIQRSLHSFIELPGHYEILNGMILPRSFVEFRKVEAVFGSSVLFFNALRDWNTEQEVRGRHDGMDYTTYPDEILMQKLRKDFAFYHVSGFSEMDFRTAGRFIAMMHRKYGCSKKQIQRVTGFDPERIERFF